MNCLVKVRLKCKRESMCLIPIKLGTVSSDAQLPSDPSFQFPRGNVCSGWHPCQGSTIKRWFSPSLSWFILTNICQSKTCVILSKYLRYLLCATSLSDLWANCIFTSPSLDLQLARRLPARVQGYPWRLAYSTLEHGTSLKTLYRKSASLDSPVLLVIKDMDNQVRLVPLIENTF